MYFYILKISIIVFSYNLIISQQVVEVATSIMFQSILFKQYIKCILNLKLLMLNKCSNTVHIK